MIQSFCTEMFDSLKRNNKPQLKCWNLQTTIWFHIQVCWQSVWGASAFKIIKHSSIVCQRVHCISWKKKLCHFCLNMLCFSPVTHLQWLKHETSCSVMSECSDHCWINKYFCFNKKSLIHSNIFFFTGLKLCYSLILFSRTNLCCP